MPQFHLAQEAAVPHNIAMGKNRVLFHIARKGGLEFVFTSGNALRYPLHTHVSVYTITIVRRGVVYLGDGRSAKPYPAGSTYIVAPHEPHSPAYSDNFDIVSLCLKKSLLSTVCPADLAALIIRHGRNFVQECLLSGADAQSLVDGVGVVYADAALGRRENATAPPEILLGQSASFTSPFRFIRHFKRESGLTPYQFIIQNRLREAKKALASRLPLVQVADLTGFCDQSHLNRWFNKAIGITPHVYRKSCFFLDDA